MSSDTQKLLDKVVKKWDAARALFTAAPKPHEYSVARETPIGTIEWDNPNVVWLLVAIDSSSYEGSGSQIGLTKDGRLVWEYHCSCDDFEDSDHALSSDFLQDIKDTKKSFELNSVPLDWEEQIRENAKKILAAL